jgi:hypothetical protein
MNDDPFKHWGHETKNRQPGTGEKLFWLVLAMLAATGGAVWAYYVSI